MRLARHADVAELVDALDLGSSAERRGGSSPFIRTSPLLPGAERATRPAARTKSNGRIPCLVGRGWRLRKRMKPRLSIFACLALNLVWLTPAHAQGFEDLNRPLPDVFRPGITGCGRDRPCDWQEPEMGRQEPRYEVNKYRQPRIEYDVTVPTMRPAEQPLGRGRLATRQGIIQAHRTWCADRYRSYNRRNDTFQPYYGSRRRCISPYVRLD